MIRLESQTVRPDIVFVSSRIAIFIDGCFWHSCPEHGSTPVANRDYWAGKLKRNVARDTLNTDALKESGWGVVRIWEHEDRSEAVERIVAELVTAS